MNTTPPCPDHAPGDATLWDALRYVIDPELGINIVDLGLVLSVTREHGHVAVQMIVTTPGCPMEHSLVFGIETALLSLEGVASVDVQVLRDTPWDPSMMTDQGRAMAGIR